MKHTLTSLLPSTCLSLHRTTIQSCQLWCLTSHQCHSIVNIPVCSFVFVTASFTATMHLFMTPFTLCLSFLFIMCIYLCIVIAVAPVLCLKCVSHFLLVPVVFFIFLCSVKISQTSLTGLSIPPKNAKLMF